jgi:outer membrane protein
MLIPAYALESIWYSDKDLKEDNIQRIPQGYLDPSSIDPCSTKNYDKPLSLVDITEAALCNNPQTREVYANARVQAAQVGVARSLFFPSVTDTLSATENKNWTTNYNYSNATNRIVASYLLYDFGSRDANLENANELLRAASATQNTTVQTVLLAAVNAFYQVHATRAVLNASIDSERLYQESFKSAEAKYIAGVATPADKLQAQTSFANATLTKLKNEGALKIAYGNLANIMGVPANINFQMADSQLDVIPELVDQDIEALIEQARIQRPDLIASEAQLKASLAKIEAVKADAKPKVRIDASNSNQYQENLLGQTSQNTSQIGIILSIPLFEGYKPTYLIRSAEATAELNASKRDQLKLQVSLDVWTAYQNLKTANESITASNVLVLSAEESSRVALGRYKEGVGNIIDTLNAQNALANAKQQKIQSVLNWNIARTTLAQSIGVLDNAMIQKLPEAKRQ